MKYRQVITKKTEDCYTVGSILLVWFWFTCPLSGKSHFKCKQSYADGPPLSSDYVPLSLVMILTGVISSK